MMKNLLILALIFSAAIVAVQAQTSDAALRSAIAADNADKASNGKLSVQAASLHASRAETYSANRMFPQAREHWNLLFSNYPEDPGTAKALFGTARSYMWEREYLKAVEWFDKLIKDHPFTREGRDGLSFKGASYVRAGKNLEAAKTYEQYVAMFPTGERIESAYLNIIDAYREAGKYNEANLWVDRAVKVFPGKSTVPNALQGRVRMEIYRENWIAAANAADSLMTIGNFRGSMTSLDEAKFLKAYAMRRAGKKVEADLIYRTISITPGSFYGWIASEEMDSIDSVAVTSRYYTEYPLRFNAQVIQSGKKFNVDPRFLLAIMKQESSFRPAAKSPAGARGLLQLVYDTAIKYKDRAGYKNLKPDDLYDPTINVALGSAYIADLKDQFDGMYEPIAASYNAGEDNSARWLARTKPHHPGIFASEVGFSETKNYVFKVMSNYKMYCRLYDKELRRR